MTKKECLERFDIEIACQMMREGKNQREKEVGLVFLPKE